MTIMSKLGIRIAYWRSWPETLSCPTGNFNLIKLLKSIKIREFRVIPRHGRKQGYTFNSPLVKVKRFHNKW